MNEKKQKKFEALYVKFVRKCLAENMLPIVTLKYEPNGIFPTLNYYEVDEAKKNEILSSLDKEE